jgi:hypothetical protein
LQVCPESINAWKIKIIKRTCTLSIHIASITIFTPAGGFAIDLTIVISGCFNVLSAAMAE